MSAACSASPCTGPCGCRPSPGDVIQVRDGQDPHEQAHHQQPEHRADHGLTPGPGRAHSVFNPASCGPLLPAGTWSTAHCSSRPKAPAVTKNSSNQAMARSQSQRPGPGTHLCSRAMARANPTCRLGGRHRRDAARARVNVVRYLVADPANSMRFHGPVAASRGVAVHRGSHRLSAGWVGPQRTCACPRDRTSTYRCSTSSP